MYLSQVPVPVAAKLIGAGEMTVRCGLRCGRLPIGTAYKMTGNQWRYIIVPAQLAAFLGISIATITQAVEAYRGGQSA